MYKATCFSSLAILFYSCNNNNIVPKPTNITESSYLGTRWCFIFIALYKSLRYSYKLLSFPPFYRAWNWASKMKQLDRLLTVTWLLDPVTSKVSLVTFLLYWLFFSGHTGYKIVVLQPAIKPRPSEVCVES